MSCLSYPTIPPTPVCSPNLSIARDQKIQRLDYWKDNVCLQRGGITKKPLVFELHCYKRTGGGQVDASFVEKKNGCSFSLFWKYPSSLSIVKMQCKLQQHRLIALGKLKESRETRKLDEQMMLASFEELERMFLHLMHLYKCRGEELVRLRNLLEKCMRRELACSNALRSIHFSSCSNSVSHSLYSMRSVAFDSGVETVFLRPSLARTLDRIVCQTNAKLGLTHIVALLHKQVLLVEQIKRIPCMQLNTMNEQDQ